MKKAREDTDNETWIEIVFESLLCGFPPELVFYPALVCGLFTYEHAHERYEI